MISQQIENLDNIDSFFIKIQDGILLPSEDYLEQGIDEIKKFQEKIGKNITTIQLGHIIDVKIKSIYLKDDNETISSFGYEIFCDNIGWKKVFDFRTKIINILNDRGDDSYEKAIKWALSNPAKFTLYLENDFKNTETKDIFIILNDWIPKEKNKPPMKYTSRDLSIQEKLLGHKIASANFQISSEIKKNEKAYILNIKPDPSEPSEEYEFFGE